MNFMFKPFVYIAESSKPRKRTNHFSKNILLSENPSKFSRANFPSTNSIPNTEVIHSSEYVILNYEQRLSCKYVMLFMFKSISFFSKSLAPLLSDMYIDGFNLRNLAGTRTTTETNISLRATAFICLCITCLRNGLLPSPSTPLQEDINKQ